MKTSFLALLFASTLLLVSGCGNGDAYKMEVGGLDSLQVQLDKAEQAFLSLDSSRASQTLSEVNKKLGRLNELITDTLSREEAQLLSSYRGIKKPLKEFTQKYSGTKKEITVTRKQLQDLRHDLSKGIMKKEDADFHFKKETGLATLLINSLKLSSDAVPVFLERFDLLNPKIDSLVQVKEQLLHPSPVR